MPSHSNTRLTPSSSFPHSLSSPFLASFHLHHSSLELQFLSPLSPSIGIACDVTFDPFGNSYVTNSDKNFIYKVTENGTVSVTSNSSIFTHYPVYESSYSYAGLNGVIYINHKNYLLVVQSNTGKLFKVNAINGTATAVILPSDLTLANGIAVKGDGVIVVVSINTAWFLKSDDDWANGIVIDEIALDKEGYPSSVIVKDGKRVFVIYGYVQESINVNSEQRECYRIQEIKMKKEEEDSLLWILFLVGLGLAYFLFWKVQMGKLVKDMDRKRQQLSVFSSL